MSDSGLIFLLCLVNAVFLFTVFWAVLRLRGSAGVFLRFLFLMFVSAFWLNAVLIFRMNAFPEWQREISRSIFIAGILLHSVFAVFLFSFSRLDEELKSVRFWLGQVGILILCALVFTSGIETGVEIKEGMPRPVYGSYHQLMVGFLFVFGLYTMVRFIIAYIRNTDLLLKYQQKVVLQAGGLTFLLISITNGLLPAIGNRQYAVIGSLLPMFFFAGIGHIVINGRNQYVLAALKKLMKGSEDSDANRSGLYQLSEFLSSSAKGSRQIPFHGTGGKYVLQVSREEEQPKVETNLSAAWVAGLIDSFHELQKDHRHMYFSLIKAEKLVEKQWDYPREFPAERLLSREKVLSEISENLESNVRSFGVPILIFEDTQFRFYQDLAQFKLNRQPVLICGEPGSGRRTVAKAIHFLRQKTVDMVERSLLDEFRELEDNAGGLMLEHADPDNALSVEKMIRYLRLYERKCPIYIICDQTVQSANIPEDLRIRLNINKLDTIPLRMRPRDLMYTGLWHAYNALTDSDRPLELDQETFSESLTRSEWRGNYSELMLAVQKTIFQGRPGILREIRYFSHGPEEAPTEDSELSPLEISEKKVIENYLMRNYQNKNQTARDLKITINTLNARMKKYGIHWERPD